MKQAKVCLQDITRQICFALKKKRQKEKQLCWCGTKLNSGSNIIILPVCQVPHFSFLTGYACAFSPSPCPPLIPCFVSFSTVLKAGSCSSLAEGSVCPPLAISLLFILLFCRPPFFYPPTQQYSISLSLFLPSLKQGGQKLKSDWLRIAVETRYIA